MAKAPPSFQFYPGDWLVGTRHLPRAARGTYIDLLALIWSKKTVKLDCVRLSRCLGITPDEFQEDWEEIKENFTISDDGGIINDATRGGGCRHATARRAQKQRRHATAWR